MATEHPSTQASVSNTILQCKNQDAWGKPLVRGQEVAGMSLEHLAEPGGDSQEVKSGTVGSSEGQAGGQRGSQRQELENPSGDRAIQVELDYNSKHDVNVRESGLLQIHASLSGGEGTCRLQKGS